MFSHPIAKTCFATPFLYTLLSKQGTSSFLLGSISWPCLYMSFSPASVSQPVKIPISSQIHTLTLLLGLSISPVYSMHPPSCCPTLLFSLLCPALWPRSEYHRLYKPEGCVFQLLVRLAPCMLGGWKILGKDVGVFIFPTSPLVGHNSDFCVILCKCTTPLWQSLVVALSSSRLLQWESLADSPVLVLCHFLHFP